MTIEVEIDASGQMHLLEPLIRLPPGRALLTLLDGQTNGAALLAEAVLAEDWLKPEEDEPWAHLQSGKSSSCLVLKPVRLSEFNALTSQDQPTRWSGENCIPTQRVGAR